MPKGAAGRRGHKKKGGKLFLVNEAHRFAKAAEHDDTAPQDCICTICTCGRHHCAAKVHKTDWDPNAQSEYQAAMRGQACPVRGSFKPVEYPMQIPAGADHFLSLTQKDYDEKPFSATYPRPQKIRTSSVPFEGESEAHGKFKAFPGAKPAQKVDQREGEREKLPFNAESTHRSDFQKWDASRPSRMMPPQRMIEYQPFTETTTQRAHFTPKPAQVRPGRHKDLQPALGNGPARNLQSMYGAEFGKKEAARCPVFSLQPPFTTVEPAAETHHSHWLDPSEPTTAASGKSFKRRSQSPKKAVDGSTLLPAVPKRIFGKGGLAATLP